MDLQADINWIKNELNNVRDPQLIELLKNLLTYRGKRQNEDWWNEISAEEQEEINQGIKEANAGQLIPHSLVMEKYSYKYNQI